MIRIAAFGDVHAADDSVGRLRPHLADVAARADLLLLAGDLTRCGSRAEASVLADEVEGLGLPVVAVLGNHDYHGGDVEGIVDVLQLAGVQVLEGSGVRFRFGDTTVGVAGTKGFGGGFPGASGSDFGEPEMRAFMGRSRSTADGLGRALAALGTDVRIALTHYAPVTDTLLGERLEIYPFLGCSSLAEVIDLHGAHLALHGHAHNGSEHGVTPGGVPVRNVAQPVLRAAYRVYLVDESRAVRESESSPRSREGPDGLRHDAGEERAEELYTGFP